MQCSSCGTILSPGISICPKCGYRTYSNTNHFNDPVSYDVVPYIEHRDQGIKQNIEQRIPYMEQRPPSLPPSITPATSLSVMPPLLTEQEESVYSPLVTPPPPPQRTTRWKTALLVLLSLILIIGGVIFVRDTTVLYPADLHAQATVVTRTFLTAQAQGIAKAASRATITANATVNAMTPAQVYQQATSGAPVIDDALNDDSGNVWYSYGPTKGKAPCSFSAGAYHIQAGAGTNYCIGVNTLFSNLAFQAQMTIIKGNSGGLMFRSGGGGGNNGAYAFFISANGNYALAATDQQQQWNNLKSGTSTTITTGLKHSNQITVIARASHIYLYVNGQFVDSIVDTRYTSGHIALVGSSNSRFMDIAFNNVKVWGL